MYGDVAAGDEFLGDDQEYVGLPEFAVGEEEDFRGWRGWRGHIISLQYRKENIYVQYIQGSQTC